MELRPRDESPHLPTEDPAWGEAWWFDFTGTVRCTVQLVLRPAELRRRYWACLDRGDDLIAVIEDDVPPTAGNALELRTHGLWADHIIEDPFDHISVGCEAFALRLDPPIDLTKPATDLVGDRIAFGLDLGWEATGPVAPRPDGRDGYELPCEVHGEVLVADQRIAINGSPGLRGHLWGPYDWTALGWLAGTPGPPPDGPQGRLETGP